jgi:NADH-quinone oxidoreductase subunit N
MLSWPVLVPEALIGAAALAAWVLPWSNRRSEPRRGVERRLELPAVFGALVLVAWIVELSAGAGLGTLFHGGFVQDRFALDAKSFLLLATLLTVLLADWEIADEPERELALVLWACFGGLVAASAGDLVVLWAGWLLASTAAIAALTGIAASHSREARGSPEPALRLAVSAGALLFLAALAFAIVYATAGQTDLAGIAGRLPEGATSGSLAVAAVAVVVAAGGGLLLAGLLLRGAAWWPADASVATGPIAGLAAGAAGVVLLRFAGALVGSVAAWAPLLAVVAAALIVSAAAGALATRSLRGLIGWLALGQAGWILAGVAAHGRLAVAGALYLLGAYLVAVCGVSALLGEDILDRLPALAGRAGRGLAAALALTAGLLSLSGVPPIGGAFGELSVLSALASAGYLWLVLLGLGAGLLTMVAVARSAWTIFLAPAAEARPAPVNAVRLAGAVALIVGFFANPLHGLAVQGAEALGLP